MRKIVLSVLYLLVSVFALAGCSNNSEPFEEKTYTPDTQISEINLDVRDREIEVALSSDEQVHIQYSENSKEYYKIAVSDENVLTMTSTSDKDWADYIGGKASAEARKILLQIPDALLDNLTLSTTNENIFAMPAWIFRRAKSLDLCSLQRAETEQVVSYPSEVQNAVLSFHAVQKKRARSF